MKTCHKNHVWHAFISLSSRLGFLIKLITFFKLQIDYIFKSDHFFLKSMNLWNLRLLYSTIPNSFCIFHFPIFKNTLLRNTNFSSIGFKWSLKCICHSFFMKTGNIISVVIFVRPNCRLTFCTELQKMEWCKQASI